MSTGYRFATICSSNVNRSMEAHDLFRVRFDSCIKVKKNRLDVVSFGTGSEIKIPGLTAKTPNVYLLRICFE